MSWYTSYNHIHGTHSSEGLRRQGKKDRPATALELWTYALSRSFTHGDRSRSSVPHRSYVPVTGVPLSSDTSDLRLEAGTVPTGRAFSRVQFQEPGRGNREKMVVEENSSSLVSSQPVIPPDDLRTRIGLLFALLVISVVFSLFPVLCSRLQ